MRARAVKAAWRSAARAEISAKLRPFISLMSAPAANTFSPPQRTTAPTRSSRPASAAAARSSSWTWALRAFTGGRSSRMVPTRLASSTSRRTNSPTSGPSRLFGSGGRIVCAATPGRRPSLAGSAEPDRQALVGLGQDEVGRRPGPVEAERRRPAHVGDAPRGGSPGFGPARDDRDPLVPFGSVELLGQRLDVDGLPVPLEGGGVEDDDAHLRADGQVARVAGARSRHPVQVGVALVGVPHR